MNTQSKPQRRTREQWQQLVQEWQHSSESAKAFCVARSIGYARFCQWRKRLLSQEAVPQDNGGAPELLTSPPWLAAATEVGISC